MLGKWRLSDKDPVAGHDLRIKLTYDLGHLTSAGQQVASATINGSAALQLVYQANESGKKSATSGNVYNLITPGSVNTLSCTVTTVTVFGQSSSGEVEFTLDGNTLIHEKYKPQASDASFASTRDDTDQWAFGTFAATAKAVI